MPHTIGIATAAHVDAHAGVAVTGNEGVGVVVAQAGAIATTGRQVLQDARHRLRLGVLGEPSRRHERQEALARSCGANAQRHEATRTERVILCHSRATHRRAGTVHLGPAHDDTVVHAS